MTILATSVNPVISLTFGFFKVFCLGQIYGSFRAQKRPKVVESIDTSKAKI